MKIWFGGWLKYKPVFASSFNSAPWQPDWAVTLMRLIAYSGLNSRGDSALLIGGSCTRGESIGSTFSLLSSLLFPDIPHRRVKTGNTKLDSESIIRPIYQLGSLCSKNKHITALQSSSPSLLLQGPSQHPVWRSGRTIGWLCCTDAVCGCHQGTSKCVPI